jgi:hypothetical protein
MGIIYGQMFIFLLSIPSFRPHLSSHASDSLTYILTLGSSWNTHAIWILLSRRGQLHAYTVLACKTDEDLFASITADRAQNTHTHTPRRFSNLSKDRVVPSTSQPIPKLLVLAIRDIRKFNIFQMALAEDALLLCRRQFVPSLVLPHIVSSQRESKDYGYRAGYDDCDLGGDVVGGALGGEG